MNARDDLLDVARVQTSEAKSKNVYSNRDIVINYQKYTYTYGYPSELMFWTLSNYYFWY